MTTQEKELQGIISGCIGENYPLLQDGLFQLIDSVVEPLSQAIIAKYGLRVKK
jgi:hypothetical protein